VDFDGRALTRKPLVVLRLRHEADDSPDHFQVYTGQVRIGTIYKTSGNPSGNSWFWGLNGVQNGPGPFNGFVRTLDDAKAEFAAAWGAWLKAAELNEDTPTAQLKTRIPRRPDLYFRLCCVCVPSPRRGFPPSMLARRGRRS
jgi:hypothetical protein